MSVTLDVLFRGSMEVYTMLAPQHIAFSFAGEYILRSLLPHVRQHNARVSLYRVDQILQTMIYPPTLSDSGISFAEELNFRGLFEQFRSISVTLLAMRGHCLTQNRISFLIVMVIKNRSGAF